MSTTRRSFLKACGLACLAPLPRLTGAGDDTTKAIVPRLLAWERLPAEPYKETRIISFKLWEADTSILHSLLHDAYSLNRKPMFGIPPGCLLLRSISFCAGNGDVLGDVRCEVTLRAPKDWRILWPMPDGNYTRVYSIVIYPRCDWDFIPASVRARPWWEWPTLEEKLKRARVATEERLSPGPPARF